MDKTTRVESPEERSGSKKRRDAEIPVGYCVLALFIPDRILMMASSCPGLKD